MTTATLAASQVIRSRAALVDAFDLSLGIAQRNELLQEFRIRVLNVVEVDHDIIAHLESEIQLLNFFNEHLRLSFRWGPAT